MLPGSVAKTNLGIFIGIFTGWTIYYEPFGHLSPIASWSIAVVGLLFHAWGCFNYVVGKGQTPGLSLIGLLPLGLFLAGLIPGFHPPTGSILLVPLGLLIIAVLPDLTQKSTLNQRAESYHRQNSRFAPPPPPPKSPWAGALTAVLIVATFAILGFTIYRATHQPRPITVEEAQQRAVQQYPDLAVANSSLNREFLARYRHYQATDQTYFNDQSWPLHLAAESQAAVEQGRPSR